MLGAFGTFWVGEGIGLAWPGQDWAILALIAAYLVMALALVPICRKLRSPSSATTKNVADKAPSGVLAKFWHELAGLFVDDGVLACGIVIWVAAAKFAQPSLPIVMTVACLAFAAGCAVLLLLSAVRGALTHR